MVMGLGSFSGQSVATKIVAADGSGDFTTIQAALDDLPSTGGVVYVKEGNYTITAAISIPNSSVAIIGAGAATVITSTSDINLLTATSKNDVMLDSLQFSGSSMTTVTNACVSLDTCTRLHVTRCTFSSAGGIGVLINAGVNAEVSFCIFTSGLDKAISITGSSGGSIIANNLISQATTDGISITGGAGQVINANRILSCGNSGIFISGISEQAIVGNVCNSNTQSGIELSLVNDSVVSDNVCNSNTQHGISFTTCLRNVVSGNASSENDSAASASYDGIFLNASDRNVINGNQFWANGRYGVNVSNATCDVNLVSDNHVFANTTGQINNVGTGTVTADNVTT
mgnify:CR=1 FL=1